MSQVLVSPPLTMPLMEAEECQSSQQPFHLAVNPADAAYMEEKRTASQLAYLASQHHTSEYNRLKFGPGGAPVMYIPLSIQVPAHVRELKARQSQSSQKRMWWPADARGDTHTGDLMDVNSYRPLRPTYTSGQQENLDPCPQLMYGTGPELYDPTTYHSKSTPPLNHPPAVNLQRELSVAMSSPLSIITIPQLSPRVVFQPPNLNLHTKTSESHPINISPIVPFELLPLITSHLAPTPPHSAYMFDLPPSLLLHRLASQSTHPPSDLARSYPLTRVANGSLSYPLNGANQPNPDQLSLASRGIPDPAVITTDGLLMTNTHAQNSSTLLHTYGDSETIPQSGHSLLPEPSPHRDIMALSVSTLNSQSTQHRPHSAPPTLFSSPLTIPEVLANGIVTSPPPLSEVVYAMSSDILSTTDVVRDAEKDRTSCSVTNSVSHPIAWTHNLAPGYAPPLRPALGNILLSSCPGKKVRLSGPVKGRGAICRDLGHDLRRVRALGVGCIICCLDDEELEFLGAPWPQYSEIARAVGLDVLRIPIPEGLAPLSPALFDKQLSYIIHSYTLQGVPILAHCRGGVGRAGLVACCWTLKLGLCGWLAPTLEETVSHPVSWNDGEILKVRRETLGLVERVIAIVRRRRSVKAIETYEQVRFLVEFVEHLNVVGASMVP